MVVVVVVVVGGWRVGEVGSVEFVVAVRGKG
jgi:hypothetical protein